MSNLVFTFIFNGYDTLKDPTVITPGWDYIFLSDKKVGSDIWIPVDVSEKVKHISDPKRKASLMKIEHYRYVPTHYDLCMALDGSMLLNTDLNKFIDQYWKEGTDLLIAKHPYRKCIYEEAVVVIKAKYDSEDTVFNHMKRYRQEGYPRYHGLYGTRMMIKNNRSTK